MKEQVLYIKDFEELWDIEDLKTLINQDVEIVKAIDKCLQCRWKDLSYSYQNYLKETIFNYLGLVKKDKYNDYYYYTNTVYGRNKHCNEKFSFVIELINNVSKSSISILKYRETKVRGKINTECCGSIFNTIITDVFFFEKLISLVYAIKEAKEIIERLSNFY